jgi:hypothetical protein
MAYSSWLIRIAKRLDNRNLDSEEDGCFSTETVCAPKKNENDEEDVDVDSGALSPVRILGLSCCNLLYHMRKLPKFWRNSRSNDLRFHYSLRPAFWKQNTALLDALV